MRRERKDGKQENQHEISEKNLWDDGEGRCQMMAGLDGDVSRLNLRGSSNRHKEGCHCYVVNLCTIFFTL